MATILNHLRFLCAGQGFESVTPAPKVAGSQRFCQAYGQVNLSMFKYGGDNSSVLFSVIAESKGPHASYRADHSDFPT